ncbi:MAG: hypothetical protein ACKODX_05610 [Gemmata sp.]
MFARLAVLALFAVAVPPVVGADDKGTTRVTGTVIVPKEVPSFDNRVVELRLYSVDKNIADKGADLVERVELKEFSHTTGKETRTEFAIGAAGKLDPKNRYYITAFVLNKDARTHIGTADHVKEPFNKVLTDGNPREVTIRFKEIGKR